MSNDEIKDIEDRLIEAAKTIFVQKGYANTRMGDIAAAVGISRTSMHYYFRTKEMLFEAIFGQILGTILPNLDVLIDKEGTILDKLPDIIHVYNTGVRNNPLLPLFIVNEIHRDAEHLYHAIMKYPDRVNTILRLRKLLVEEMEKGVIKKMPLIDLLTTFISMVIFPVMLKKPFTDVLLNGENEAFEKYLDRREVLILQIMKEFLAPVKATDNYQ